ncbi:hypothetical protein AVEN_116647-1 [Araneus ventricosus]|uniref:Reverse transcriptase zinc-binding domain-containing protein n=1 Tax=Araneus ventricosus TaxID=182803 RepID=A0A4Y2QHM3_ARAVE|nr:hypothetical protein AVEN_116647-1 [Araneus ventricosus]
MSVELKFLFADGRSPYQQLLCNGANSNQNRKTQKFCFWCQDMVERKTKEEKKLMNKTRKGDILLSKFRTNKLLHRFNIVSSPDCECCVHAEETIKHIFFLCPRYRDPRLHNLKEIPDLNPVYSDSSLKDC